MLGAEKLRSYGLLGGSVDLVGSGGCFRMGRCRWCGMPSPRSPSWCPPRLVPAELVFAGSVLVEIGAGVVG